MPDQPLVSIIIPTFNRAHLIGETLDSVIAQTYQNWECIVVDDGSTDNTPEVMEEYIKKDSRIQYHHRPPEHKPGGNGARNYGFKLSRGEYIQWFDDDDIMLPNFLEFKINRISDEIQLIITSGYEWDVKTIIKQPVCLKIENNLYTDYSLWNIKILTPSVFFKKSFLRGKELFQENLICGQEMEFFNRLFWNLDNKRFLLFSEYLFLYRQHKESKRKEKRIYHSDFKLSEAYIQIVNFERASMIHNSIVMDYALNIIIALYFNALGHKDEKTEKYIKQNFFNLIENKNFSNKVEFFIVRKLLSFSDKGRYFFKTRWKKQIIKNWDVKKKP